MRMVLVAAMAVLSGFAVQAQSFVDVHGRERQPFASSASARVFLFARTDCPLVDRYAPELQHISKEFSGQGVEFWIVYPGRSEQKAEASKQVAEYRLPGVALLDPKGELVRRAGATVSPEIAVFDRGGRLTYLGRIDDRVVDFGKARPFATTHDAEDAIAATLAGKPVAQARTRAVGCYLADLQ